MAARANMGDSRFFSTQFMDPRRRASERELGPARHAVRRRPPLSKTARAASRNSGAGSHVAALSEDGWPTGGPLATCSSCRCLPTRKVIGQDEQGDYMLIVLDGTVAVDRVQPWGAAPGWLKPVPATCWARCRC